MAIFLYTDFGAADVYVGQVRAALLQHSPQIAVVDLMHEAPAFNVRAGAHLLAALVQRLPEDCVVMAVVDPGVGGEREPVAVRADGRWFVGPDNGLVSVAAGRARAAEAYRIDWRPDGLSASFHGRDLFAPASGLLAAGAADRLGLVRKTALAVDFGAGDLAEIVYVDHYGNALSGLRAAGVARDARYCVNGIEFHHARVFSAVPPGTAFWYENSLGLVEFAVNQASAAQHAGIRCGDGVARFS